MAVYRDNITRQERKLSLATICLDLYENMEFMLKGTSVVIKCVPDDSSFEKQIVLKGYMYPALEIIFSELLSVFGSRKNQITVSTKDNGILVTGINITEEGLEDLCLDKNKHYSVAQCEMGVAMAYLMLNGIVFKAAGMDSVLILFCHL